MDSIINSMNKDSYLERRLLFKNIWDAAHVEKKDKMDFEDVPKATKPKVIKTLRLSEEGSINRDINKKQRIKNLRIVCTRLLEICNKKENDDILYDQISAARHDSNLSAAMFARRLKPKKKRKKKKVNKAYATMPIDEEDTISLDIDTDGPITHRGTTRSRHVVPPIIERATLIRQFKNERYKLENELGDAHRRVVKKKKQKKKTSTSTTSPRLGTTSKRVPTHRIKKNVNNGDTTSDALI